jgi:hypothetical protein
MLAWFLRTRSETCTQEVEDLNARIGQLEAEKRSLDEQSISTLRMDTKRPQS